MANQENKHPAGLNIPEGTILADTLLNIFHYNRLNELYSTASKKDPLFLIDSLFSQLHLKYHTSDDDLKNIPADGPFIAVSNHPFRGIDSMIMYKIIAEKRKDFRILASHLLHRIEPLKEIVIPVNTGETAEDVRSSYSGIREALSHLSAGHCIGIFPAGEDILPIESTRVILDNIWRPAALKFIWNSEVPVIPVYFHGTSSRIIRMMGRINPSMMHNLLPSEMHHVERKVIRTRIGSALTPSDLAEFSDQDQFGRFLRAKVYSLGSALDKGRNVNRRAKRKLSKAEPLAEETPAGILKDEFISIRDEHELFTTKNYSVICAPSGKIPAIFNEIGRLREQTFRKVGEGTSKRTDIDEYDFYFDHLFIWDTDEDRIVGAYRIGRGKEIAGSYGTKGFYINSLFRLRKRFLPVLSQSLELGRSFVTSGYQKKTIPLFLLWKGIMVFLLRNPEYRYLIGPVSISNDFSGFSKSLIVEFIGKYFADDSWSRYVSPRREFVVKPDKVTDRSVFVDVADSDINRIGKIITDIEPGYRLPVLLRKYLEINARIIAFNIDPKFNYCLDGLMILDLYKVPKKFIQGLSRQLNDDSIIARFTESGRQ